MAIMTPLLSFMEYWVCGSGGYGVFPGTPNSRERTYIHHPLYEWYPDWLILLRIETAS